MTALQKLTAPNSHVLCLKTLTPLHTGGVGQYGEQVHPSGILGSLRYFSCLLAAAIGDNKFETRVWGTDNEKTHSDRHAKKVALRIDVSGLQETKLPEKVLFKEMSWQDDQHKHNGWFYNVAQKGTFTLTLTRRGITDSDWQLLLLALRIQIHHATLGAKDQFGLGVVAADDKLPEVTRLNDQEINAQVANIPSLHHAFFAKVHFSCPVPDSLHECLEAGLRWRAHLRNSFRQPNETDLRHYIFGSLNKWGSAVNVSAVYPLTDNGCALRIWGILPHTTQSKKSPQVFNKVAEQREQILKRIKQALQTGPKTPGRAQNMTWQIYSPQQNIIAWINKLAGLS